MISIKKSMDQLEETELRCRLMLRLYTRALQAVERAVVVLAGAGAQRFRERIAEARLQAEKQAAVEVMEQGQAKIEEELDGLTHELADALDKKERDYKEVIRIVTDAAATMTQSGLRQGEELKQFATKIESVSRLESISEIREQLSSRVSELMAMAGQIQLEGQERARALEDEIQRVNEKLRHAEVLAETDVLTGLGNRRKAEKCIHAAIASGMPLSLLLFDLNGFKTINDRYGHGSGDQLLKAVARQMQNAVRETDIVCRWGGDEFVILLAEKLAEAGKRAARIQRNAFGHFIFNHNEQTISVNLSASFGVAEYQAGQTAEEFFERADGLLYERKRQRQPDRAALAAAQ